MMGEAMQQYSGPVATARFQATIDELVDLQLRALKGSKVLRRQKILVLSVAVATLFTLSFLLLSLTTDAPVLSRIEGSLLFSGLVGLFGFLAYDAYHRKQMRILLEEQGGKNLSAPVAFEVRPEGLTIKQYRRKWKFAWKAISKSLDKNGDVVFRTTEAKRVFAIVRKRAFASDKELLRFIKLTQKYIDKASTEYRRPGRRLNRKR
jgi:hypothetical protein